LEPDCQRNQLDRFDLVEVCDGKDGFIDRRRIGAGNASPGRMLFELPGTFDDLDEDDGSLDPFARDGPDKVNSQVFDEGEFDGPIRIPSGEVLTRLTQPVNQAIAQ
jgi:hypothetical protein